MMRFLLRLAGALVVENLCGRIAPARLEFGVPEKPDGWLRYYGTTDPYLYNQPLVHGSLPLPDSELSWTPAFGDVVGISGRTTIGTAPYDVAYTVREAGESAETMCKAFPAPVSASGIMGVPPIVFREDNQQAGDMKMGGGVDVSPDKV